MPGLVLCRCSAARGDSEGISGVESGLGAICAPGKRYFMKKIKYWE